jgi:hypothetical protein
MDRRKTCHSTLAEIMLVWVAAWEDPDQDEVMFDRDAATGNVGPAYQRLSRVKRNYDPGNLFRLNSNIEPAA